MERWRCRFPGNVRRESEHGISFSVSVQILARRCRERERLHLIFFRTGLLIETWQSRYPTLGKGSLGNAAARESTSEVEVWFLAPITTASGHLRVFAKLLTEICKPVSRQFEPYARSTHSTTVYDEMQRQVQVVTRTFQGIFIFYINVSYG